jgi:S-adenosylmethionine hydrolase
VSRTIAFISDLGYADDAVGMCKGIMLQRSPRSQIIDITHSVTPFDVVEAAHYLADLPAYFPEDTVFCCIIFPQTGVRPCIAARNERGQLFVAGDNGVLTLVERTCALTAVHQIDNPDVMILPPTPSFVGRDIMAPCAGRLAAGLPVEHVGAACGDITRLRLEGARSAGAGTVTGSVSVIDKNFGNVWTDIPERLCLEAGLTASIELAVDFGEAGEHCFPLVRTFGDVGIGQPLAFINSRGRLAFALNQGSLVQLLRVERSARISVRPVPSAPLHPRL